MEPVHVALIIVGLICLVVAFVLLTGDAVVPAPAAPALPPYQYKGCYTDNATDRAFVNMAERLTLDECAEKAREKGAKVFGLQHYNQGDYRTSITPVRAECWTGNDASYDKHGLSDKCDESTDGQYYYGRGFANAVYHLN